MRTLLAAAALASVAVAAVTSTGCGGNGTLSYASPGPIAPETGTFLFPTAAPVVPDRMQHTATTLDDNRILIAGGTSAASTVGSPVAQAELFEPGTGNFVVTGSLGRARARHSAVKLTDGTVLVTGGEDAAGVMGAAEVYSPSSGTFTAASAPAMTARRSHSSTSMFDGSVLVVGGDTGTAGGSTPLATIERYVPGAGFSSVGSLIVPRSRHISLRRSSGDVVVAGGFTAGGGAGPTAATATVEILDESTGLPRLAAGALAQPRAGGGAVFLSNGLILIAGGFGLAGPLDTAEVYDPTNERTRGSLIMTRVRGSARVARMFDGRVLVVGDDDTADIYDPATSTFVPASSTLVFPRNGHSVTALSTANVLIFGGTVISPAATGAAELFDPR